jgi:hypothetical protein
VYPSNIFNQPGNPANLAFSAGGYGYNQPPPSIPTQPPHQRPQTPPTSVQVVPSHIGGGGLMINAPSYIPVGHPTGLVQQAGQQPVQTHQPQQPPQQPPQQQHTSQQPGIPQASIHQPQKAYVKRVRKPLSIVDPTTQAPIDLGAETATKQPKVAKSSDEASAIKV